MGALRNACGLVSRRTLFVPQDFLRAALDDGKLVFSSSAFDPDAFDLSNDKPLRIGFGEENYFKNTRSEQNRESTGVDGHR
jgi:hypothetical protein